MNVAGEPGAESPVPPTPPNPVDAALKLLFDYIPTEIVTLYVAIVAAIGQAGTVTCSKWITFWSFLVACPVVFWLTYAAKLKARQLPLPLHYSTWPIWEMFAATVAFATWAFALPESPFSKEDWYSSAISGVAVLIVSTVLGLLAPLLQQPSAAPPNPPPPNPPHENAH